MEKIYLVYYDNGQTWEDHAVSVSKVFASKESAEKYAEEKNVPIKEYTPSVTREEYNAEEVGCSYDEFIQSEQFDWSVYRDAYYYVREEELHP
jgi:hypothetical protein